MWTEHLIPAGLLAVPLDSQHVGVRVCILQGRKLQLQVAGWSGRLPMRFHLPRSSHWLGGTLSECSREDSAGAQAGLLAVSVNPVSCFSHVCLTGRLLSLCCL